eukprot:415556-Pelagomonas_calceolata.AAC.2
MLRRCTRCWWHLANNPRSSPSLGAVTPLPLPTLPHAWALVLTHAQYPRHPRVLCPGVLEPRKTEDGVLG